MKLKVVFAGTPHFAIPSLHALVEHHDVCAVYTKLDSPSGRGLKLMPSPVKELVLQRYPHIPIVQPGTLKDPESQQKLKNFGADIMVVIAYGLILPKEVLSLFKYGCINVHASLLPRWRGAAPIQRSLLAGDEATGITIMQIDEGLDTGDMLSHQDYVIQPHDTSQTLHDTLSLIGADALLSALQDIISRQSRPIPQDNLLATYAAKIKKEEALINWHENAIKIDRHIRAFNPWPIAHTFLNGNLIKIWEANLSSEINSQEIPGKIIGINEQAIEVATEQGSLYITKVQLAGGKPVTVKDFLNARSDQIKLNETILGK